MNWERQFKFVATRQTREGRENVSRVAPKVPMNAPNNNGWARQQSSNEEQQGLNLLLLVFIK